MFQSLWSHGQIKFVSMMQKKSQSTDIYDIRFQQIYRWMNFAGLLNWSHTVPTQLLSTCCCVYLSKSYQRRTGHRSAADRQRGSPFSQSNPPIARNTITLSLISWTCQVSHCPLVSVHCWKYQMRISCFIFHISFKTEIEHESFS